jgi:platelet-activating factor acetylhydrolase
LRLNLRALLQVLRVNGIPVAGTQYVDLEDDVGKESKASGRESASSRKGEVCTDDTAILERESNAISKGGAETDGLIRAWRWLDIIGMGDNSDSEGKTETETETETKTKTKTKTKKGENGKGANERAEEKEPDMADVIEPGASSPMKPRVDFKEPGVVTATT